MSSTDIVLAPGERGLYSETVRPNFLLFWLKTNMVVTNKRIAVKGPNTLLGVIPLGYEEKSMPIGSVAGVTNSLKVHAGRVIIFGIIALIGLMMLFGGDGGQQKFVGFLMLLIFGILTMNSICPRLQVTNNGGGVNDTEVSFLDSSRMEQFKTRANEIIYSASTGGQSWAGAYATGEDEFQNQHQHGPQGQPQPQGYGQQQPSQSQQQNGYWQQPQQPQQPQQYAQPDQGQQQAPQPGYGQQSQPQQHDHNQSQQSAQSQFGFGGQQASAAPQPNSGRTRTSHGQSAPSWAQRPAPRQQSSEQQPNRHSAPHDDNGTPDARWTNR